jgi:hypothetical protein
MARFKGKPLHTRRLVARGHAFPHHALAAGQDQKVSTNRSNEGPDRLRQTEPLSYLAVKGICAVMSMSLLSDTRQAATPK